MNYYEVECKCGHVGRGHYVVKTFAVYAQNGREAAQRARQLPRVKHDHKYAILSVTGIDEERASEINRLNSRDPYFKCENVQQQRTLEYIGEIFDEPDYDNDKMKRRPSNKVRYARKRLAEAC